MRRFRVSLPAADATREPSFEMYESRDACLWSPNVLMRCAPPDGPLGEGVSYAETGGIRRCEESFTQPRPAGQAHRVPLSREFNHRVIETDGAGDLYETPLAPGESYQRWRREPRPHEAVEHNTSTSLARPQELMG